MKPTTIELLDALPEDLRQDEPASPATAAMVPTGRVRRLWAMGALEAKLALAFLAWWVRRGFLGDGRDRARDQLHLDAAVRIAATMSYLRGAAMKMGQLLGNVPGALPAQYMETLHSLQFEAPPMHFSMLRELVRHELGNDPETLFERFDTRAFAAASLGQVHRARTRDGRDVAVKIQYPDIGRTIRSDLRNLALAIAPLRLSSEWDNLHDQFKVLRSMLEQETDYVQEAEAMRRARSVFREEDEIVVPRVHDDLSTARVLTMDYLPGTHVHELMRGDPDPDLRHRHGRQISVALFRLFYRERFVFADPHPGNFLFMPDGRLGLIDFGCCHVFTDDEWRHVLNIDAFLHEEELDWDAAVMAGTPFTEAQKRDERRLGTLRRTVQWFWKPLLTEGPFDFSDGDYIREGFEHYFEIGRRRYTRAYPVNVWLHRFLLGYRVILHLLGATVDVRRIYRSEREAVSG